jgi:hypothetical protein
MQAVIPAEKELPDGQASWQAVEKEVIRALSLRHRPYRMEQSYPQWLRHFGPYVGFMEPRTVIQKDPADRVSLLKVREEKGPGYPSPFYCNYFVTINSDFLPTLSNSVQHI